MKILRFYLRGTGMRLMIFQAEYGRLKLEMCGQTNMKRKEHDKQKGKYNKDIVIKRDYIPNSNWKIKNQLIYKDINIFRKSVNR